MEDEDQRFSIFLDLTDNPPKMVWLKEKGLWQQTKELYKEKRRNHPDDSVHASVLFDEALEEMCRQNGYEKKDREGQ